MAKYKVKNTSILHDKKVYAEGSEIELTETQAKRLEDFVELIPETTKPKTQTQTQNKTQTSKTAKTKSETKTETKTKTETEKPATGETEGDKDGGVNNDK